MRLQAAAPDRARENDVRFNPAGEGRADASQHLGCEEVLIVVCG